MRKKWKRTSGRYVPKYHEKLPFNLRDEFDICEERVFYDEWENYRDGFRDLPEKNRVKFLKSRNKRIPNGFVMG